MTATGTRMTADELLRLPDDDVRYELIAGELQEMPPAGGEHGYVGGSALGLLKLHLLQHPEIGGGLFAAETGFKIARNPDTVRAPDVAYVSAARLPQARVRGYPEMAPDLVVEVVSPSDAASEVQAKAEAWMAAGVQIVWVLYPTTRSAMVYQADGSVQLLHEDDTIQGGAVLPGFACRLRDLF